MNRTVATKELRLSCGHKIPLSQYEGEETVFCQRCAQTVDFTIGIRHDGAFVVLDAPTELVHIEQALLPDVQFNREFRVTVQMPQPEKRS